jgi:hypothetical protein
MKIARLLILLALLLPGSMVPASAQDDDIRDLAGIPLAPADLAEDGYLLEGGGYLLDPQDANAIVASLDHGDQAGIARDGWQRTYMHRMILLFDALDPGSDLVADVVTLVHAYSDEAAAATAADILGDRLDELGEPADADTPTWAIDVEGVSSLSSLILADDLVIQLVSTDLTGRPNAGDHAAAVGAQIARLEGDTDTLTPLAVTLDDMKQVSFVTQPEARQLQTMRDGEWLPVVGAQPGSDHGIVDAAESQAIVTLNTSDTVIVQSWVGRFSSDDAAQAFADVLPLADIPSVMLSDGPGPRLTGTLRSGERYSGFRTPVVTGDTVAVVAILAAGRVVIGEHTIDRLADLQASCLDTSTCPSVALADILGGNDATPAVESGTGQYTSPEFGWTVGFGDLGWEMTEEGPGDFIELRDGDSLATVESVVDRHGDPQRCILENTRLLEEFESSAEITLGSDLGERPAGSEDGHAWAIYTVEPLADERADQEYTIRYDCYSLVAGDASLVVSHAAPRDRWEIEAAKGDDLRDAIDLPDAA